jgi:hypothetical protein
LTAADASSWLTFDSEQLSPVDWHNHPHSSRCGQMANPTEGHWSSDSKSLVKELFDFGADIAIWRLQNLEYSHGGQCNLQSPKIGSDWRSNPVTPPVVPPVLSPAVNPVNR